MKQKAHRREMNVVAAGGGLGTALVLICVALAGGCGRDAPAAPPNLDGLPQADLRIGEHKLRVWLATDEEHRRQGLMSVPAEQLAPLPDGTERGMLFVFPGETHSPFWMKNTITALDIAFIRTDGSIITTHTMVPLDERGYFPQGSYRYALEVRANLFSRLGIRRGDQAAIPPDLLKTAR